MKQHVVQQQTRICIIQKVKYGIKRLFDLSFSLSVLICGAPFFFIIACLIRMSSKGPVFFASTRVGRNGELIRCFKFRTMVFNANERLREVLAENMSLKDEWRKYRKLRDDPRVTKIGKFLRQTSLDELPQFWNVFRGEMSVVGPRPVTREEIEKHYAAYADRILSVRPGITGRWQVSKRNEMTIEERAVYEATYAEDWTLYEDFLILFKTVYVILLRKGF